MGVCVCFARSWCMPFLSVVCVVSVLRLFICCMGSVSRSLCVHVVICFGCVYVISFVMCSLSYLCRVSFVCLFVRRSLLIYLCISFVMTPVCLHVPRCIDLFR